MKLTVNSKGVWLDEHEIKGCSQVDIKNINPIDNIQVLLHLTVDEVDVRYHSEEILQHLGNELSNKRECAKNPVTETQDDILDWSDILKPGNLLEEKRPLGELFLRKEFNPSLNQDVFALQLRVPEEHKTKTVASPVNCSLQDLGILDQRKEVDVNERTLNETERLGLAWCRLNKGQWDDYINKPVGYDLLPETLSCNSFWAKRKHQRTKQDCHWDVMAAIQSIIGEANISWSWWRFELGKSREEWLQWYLAAASSREK